MDITDISSIGSDDNNIIAKRLSFGSDDSSVDIDFDININDTEEEGKKSGKRKIGEVNGEEGKEVEGKDVKRGKIGEVGEIKRKIGDVNGV